jgi:cyclopropane-fatty-acyl-phospholipid synthase
MNRWLQTQAKKLFFLSLKDMRGGFLEVVCPEETYRFGDPGSPDRAIAVIHDERFFLRAVTGADIGIGESYMDGDWSTPDLVSLVRLVARNLRLIDSRNRFLSGLNSLVSLWKHRRRANTLKGSAKNIQAHYDLGNDFYRLFLDHGMVYSSAVFQDHNDSLENAQEQKLDLICRKLQLAPGQRVLEIGSGWGAFAIYAALRYGVHVTGVTISPAQYSFAAHRVSQLDLAPGSAKFVLQDYRSVEGQFDKIVSIEMFEAVGFEHYDEFFTACDRLLAPEGCMLLQTITIPEQEVAAYRKRVDWIQTYIFPGSELASVNEILRSLGKGTKLSLTDLQTMGLHYARTLAIWRERFFENLEAVRQQGFDDRFIRMWDFYFGWCEGAFRERYVNVAQILLAKSNTQEPLLGDPFLEEADLRPGPVSV